MPSDTTGRIVACAIAPNLDYFDQVIDQMQDIFGNGWGGLGLDDAIPVLQSRHSEQMDHVVIVLAREDAFDANVILSIISAAKQRNIKVTIVTENMDPSTLQILMRSDADQFLPYPLPAGALRANFDRLSPQAAPVFTSHATNVAQAPATPAPVPAPEPAPMQVDAPAEMPSFRVDPVAPSAPPQTPQAQPVFNTSAPLSADPAPSEPMPSLRRAPPVATAPDLMPEPAAPRPISDPVQPTAPPVQPQMQQPAFQTVQPTAQPAPTAIAQPEPQPVAPQIPTPQAVPEQPAQMAAPAQNLGFANTGKKGVVLPVYGMAGGVGASTFAANLAWELQSVVGKNDGKVCLLDFGFQFGSIATYLDVGRSDVGLEFLSSPDLDAQAFTQAVPLYKNQLAILPAPVDAVPLEVAEASEVAALLDLATSMYDYVIIDLPTALVSWSEEVLQRASLYLALGEVEMRSAQNALRFLRVLKADDLPYEKVQFIINRAPKKTDISGRSRMKRMSDSLNVEFRWQLPDGGKQVLTACDQGAPLSEVAPRNPLRKEIRKIAENLVQLSNTDEPKKARA